LHRARGDLIGSFVWCWRWNTFPVDKIILLRQWITFNRYGIRTKGMLWIQKISIQINGLFERPWKRRRFIWVRRSILRILWIRYHLLRRIEIVCS
jgi:hypothetical protein